MAELQKGVAGIWLFKMVDETDFATPEPGKSPTVYVSKDGGAWATSTNAASELDAGDASGETVPTGAWYKVTLTATERACDVQGVRAEAAGCAQTDGVFYLSTYKSGAAEFTVSGTVGVQEPGNRNSSPIALEMFQTEAKTFLFGPKLDADGNAVDLSGVTLRLVVTDANNVSKFQVDGGAISGDADGNATATVSAAQSGSGTTGDHLPWVLWDVDADEELWNGSLMIRPALKGT